MSTPHTPLPVSPESSTIILPARESFALPEDIALVNTNGLGPVPIAKKPIELQIRPLVIAAKPPEGFVHTGWLIAQIITLYPAQIPTAWNDHTLWCSSNEFGKRGQACKLTLRCTSRPGTKDPTGRVWRQEYLHISQCMVGLNAVVYINSSCVAGAPAHG